MCNSHVDNKNVRNRKNTSPPHFSQLIESFQSCGFLTPKSEVLSEVLGEVFGKDLTLRNPSKYWSFREKSEVVRSFYKLIMIRRAS